MLGSATDIKNVGMPVQSFVARRHITTKAAKDLLDLVKVSCPENSIFENLKYSTVQETCGNCEIFIQDICENCSRIFLWIRKVLSAERMAVEGKQTFSFQPKPQLQQTNYTTRLIKIPPRLLYY